MGSLDKIGKVSKREARKRLLKADPTTFSRHILPNEVLKDDGRNDKGRRILKSKIGERFHHTPDLPKRQQFFSRVLKPFFPFADILKYDGKFYAYEPVMGRVPKKSREEVRIELDMIDCLTGDWDHNVYPDDNVLREGKKTIYFDSEGSEFFPERMQKIRGSFQKLEMSLRTPNRKIIKKAFLKSHHMLTYWKSDEGRSQVLSAFRDAGRTTKSHLRFGPKGWDSTFEDFYSGLVERSERIHAIAKDAYLRSLERQSNAKRYKILGE